MILGKSPLIQEMNRLIERVAGSKTNILIFGESGTGKELVARQIHDLGPLKDFPFVAVNCGAIPENLIETEMFGHHKGSFTGAVADKTGLFEVAHRGTLFLDEVGELPLAMQVKLLRVIQERTFRKVGGVHDVKVDVRIIAATNKDLELASQRGTFREDLFYRLNVIMIRTPPLRVRQGDIPILVEHFLKKFAAKRGKEVFGVEPITLSKLEAYAWPGNVRELENCIERAVTLETGKELSLDALPASLLEAIRQSEAKSGASAPQEIRLPAPHFSQRSVKLDSILSEVEKVYVLAALEHARGDKKKAADLLGLTLRSLRYRLDKLGLE